MIVRFSIPFEFNRGPNTPLIGAIIRRMSIGINAAMISRLIGSFLLYLNRPIANINKGRINPNSFAATAKNQHKINPIIDIPFCLLLSRCHLR